MRDRLKEDEEKRLGEEERNPQCSATPETPPLAQCYRRARKKFGDQGATVIGWAVRNGIDVDVIAETLEDAPDVQDLAYFLWRP
jgi:hypothetical protein